MIHLAFVDNFIYNLIPHFHSSSYLSKNAIDVCEFHTSAGKEYLIQNHPWSLHHSWSLIQELFHSLSCCTCWCPSQSFFTLLQTFDVISYFVCKGSSWHKCPGDICGFPKFQQRKEKEKSKQSISLTFIFLIYRVPVARTSPILGLVTFIRINSKTMFLPLLFFWELLCQPR